MSAGCITSPLSQSQKIIWALLGKGLTVTNIAEKLKTTRQYVNQTRLTAQTKLATTLLEVAAVNDLQVTKLVPQQAILLGYHPALKKKSHHNLHHYPRPQSLVLARPTRRSHRPSLPKPNPPIPNRHRP